MSTSITIRRYLEKQDIRYQSRPFQGNPAQLFRNGTQGLRAQNIAKAVILKDYRGLVMAVAPAPDQLKVDSINRRLKRRLVPAKQEDYTALFADCSPHLIPPLGEAYGLECIVDDSLLHLDQIHFVSGNQGELLCISTDDFQWLHNNAWYGNTFYPIAAPMQTDSDSTDRDDTEEQNRLPPLPTIANQILLLNQGNSNPEELAKLVEKDPHLAKQIVHYADSRFYGVRETIISVRQAISRVLGYELASNIALGIAACRSLRPNTLGPLGRQAYWRHATYSATLAQGLAYAVAPHTRIQPGMAFLCGILHNAGTLLQGQWYPQKLDQLSQALALYPNTNLLEHENQLLQSNHAQLGAQLLQHWNMPRAAVVSALEHHNPNYEGDYEHYPALLYIVDALLKRHGLGDAAATDLPQHSLRKLGLSYSQVLDVVEKTFQGSTELDLFARKLAA
ncbi:MAG: HDOD domain-containing protein [Gammaproteobacteria bacterium]|nr:HDOD domain-containing protein [Gammaproteobacteria bacterium]MDH5799405.1 HDOD domain-containing protein [Gammaproteobacteria bacterium]